MEEVEEISIALMLSKEVLNLKEFPKKARTLGLNAIRMLKSRTHKFEIYHLIHSASEFMLNKWEIKKTGNIRKKNIHVFLRSYVRTFHVHKTC